MSATTLCALPGCTRPAYESGGIVHKYCGRTHASEAQGGNLRDPGAGGCQVCKLEGCSENVCFDSQTGRVHDFCSWTHAKQATDQGQWPRSLRGSCSAAPRDRCSLPRCSAARHIDRKTCHTHNYCGRSHAVQAARSGVDMSFKRGNDDGEEFSVLVLKPEHPKFAGIQRQFLDQWLHEGQKPIVERVLQVRNTTTVFSKYESYMERQSDLGFPSEVRRFHGTSLAPGCDFGVDFSTGPCSQDDCAVCGICRNGFIVERGAPNGATRMALRFGPGHYFSRTSSKSNDYAAGSERGREKRKVMFLCKVAIGKTFPASQANMSEDEIQREVRDNGFTSLTAASTSNDGPLNYDELVVFEDSAAIPSYLVVYRNATAGQKRVRLS